MFEKILDLLIKQDDERRKASFLFLKILFTGTIVANFYSCLFGNYTIIAITDSKALIDFFLHGTAFVCFSLFYFIWVISYESTSIVLSLIGVWMSNRAYDVINKIINNPDSFFLEVSKKPILLKIIRFSVTIYNSIDIIEIEGQKVTPGTNFYKFHDYLLDVEEGKKTVSRIDFSNTIALMIQFFIIYNLFDFHFIGGL